MSDFGGDSLRRQMEQQEAWRQSAMRSVGEQVQASHAAEQMRAQATSSAQIEQRLANERAEAHRKEQLSELAAIKEATLESQAATTAVQGATLKVQEATAQVADAVVDMNASTTRLQKWAIGLGLVGTAVGAVVGGFAGAIAARLVGN